MNKLTFGIIGCGRITTRFLEEVKVIQELSVTHVYNPRRESAEKYAKENGLDVAASLDELAREVDAVYVASPHKTHGFYVQEMLQRGKHVLCEKPLAFSREEASNLYALAREKGRILMEAVKTAYCPGFRGILEVVQAGKIGEVIDVEAAFSKLSPSNGREVWDEEAGGSFPELGTYSLLPIVKLLGTNPTKVSFHNVFMGNGEEGYCKAVFDYENAVATAKTGILAKTEGQLLIAGTKGYILCPSPWWLTKTFEVRYEDASKIEKYQAPFDGAGLRYEIATFADRIWNGNVYDCFTEEESVWMAGVMEEYLKTIKPEPKAGDVKIWAHRGCSYAYPENTLLSFQKAAELDGLTGIELDVQLTKDGELVVIHDEKVDRTTDGSGAVKDYTLAQLKALSIQSVDENVERIPTLREVFDTLLPYLRQGLKINIEMKNSVEPYPGMEEKVLALIEEYGILENIIFSSFNHASMGKMKKLCPMAKTGTLGVSAMDCLAGKDTYFADAIHPYNGGLPLSEKEKKKIAHMPVRVWNGEEPLFGQDRILKETNMCKYGILGATDIFTNIPEHYLKG